MSERAASPTFVCRETAARLIEISVDTWDMWNRQGFVPAPAIRHGGVIRWYWPAVEEALAGRGKMAAHADPIMMGVANAQPRTRRRAAS